MTEVCTLIWRTLSARRRIQLLGILSLMLVASGAELISIAMLLPFMSVAAGAGSAPPENNSQIYGIDILVGDLQSMTTGQLAIMFSLAVIVAAIIRISASTAQAKFSYKIGHDINIKCIDSFSFREYELHISDNSSNPISIINAKSPDIVLYVINPLLIIINCACFATLVVIFSLILEPVATTSLIIIIIFLYYLYNSFTRYLIEKLSRIINQGQLTLQRQATEFYNSFRFARISQTVEYFRNAMVVTDERLKSAQSQITAIGVIPKFVIEAALISALALYIGFYKERLSSADIATFAVLALIAQRLLPLLQQVFLNVTYLRGNSESLREAMRFIANNEPVQKCITIPPNQIFSAKNLILENVSYRYPAGREALKDASVTFEPGRVYGIKGPTGAGKSTLIDLLTGLIKPTAGQILLGKEQLDDEIAQKFLPFVSIVPQSIYLSDGSIRDNIAFGQPPELIDDKKIMECCEIAQIHREIMAWPDSYDTRVGEGGAALSGGQRQRIGVARALYSNPMVLLLDEATSALDDATELRLINSLHHSFGNMTVIMIAHRLSTLNKCDFVIELRSGKIHK